MYSCLLDAANGFDRLHAWRLFNKLLKRMSIRLICISFDRVASGTYKLEYFCMHNDAKQGVIIILSTAYIDDLLISLEASVNKFKSSLSKVSSEKKLFCDYD